MGFSTDDVQAKGAGGGPSEGGAYAGARSSAVLPIPPKQTQSQRHPHLPRQHDVFLPIVGHLDGGLADTGHQTPRDTIGMCKVVTVTVRRRDNGPRPGPFKDFDRAATIGRRAKSLRDMGTGNAVMTPRVEAPQCHGKV